MRKIVAFNRVSADGYFADGEGKLDWAVPDDELDRDAWQGSSEVDTILLGRRTYQMFESYWPKVAAESSATAHDPHIAGRQNAELKRIALWIDQAQKIVFSRSLKEARWKNTRIVPRFDPAEVTALKNGPGKDMILFGSGSIASLLTEHGLIDEYRFVIDPLLLGNGRTLLSGVPKRTRVALAEAKPYRAGNVMLRYTRAPG